jgi:hypothetical protein
MERSPHVARRRVQIFQIAFSAGCFNCDYSLKLEDVERHDYSSVGNSSGPADTATRRYALTGIEKSPTPTNASAG